MAEDFLAEPVWPTNPGSDSEAAPAGNSGEDEAGAVAEGDEGGSDDAETGDGTDKSTGIDEAAKAKAEAKKEAPADERPQEPATRKTKFDFIMERKRKQAEREEAKAKEPGGSETDDGNGDDYVAPEDEATIENVVRKKYGAQFEAVEKQRFENEVTEFFQKDSVAKYATDKEKALFKEYAMHPSRQAIPYETIILEALGSKRLMEIGAGIEREAAKKAGQSKAGGGSGQRQDGASGKPDYSTMSDSEFEAEQQRIRQSGR